MRNGKQKQDFLLTKINEFSDIGFNSIAAWFSFLKEGLREDVAYIDKGRAKKRTVQLFTYYSFHRAMKALMSRGDVDFRKENCPQPVYLIASKRKSDE